MDERKKEGPGSDREEKKEMDRYPEGDTMVEVPLVREASVAYETRGQGNYTLEDYYTLPDDQRVELIDGEFYDMASPLLEHQEILTMLSAQFIACQEAHPGFCKVYFAPCDVQLDKDDRTMVQPDLFVICDMEKRKRRAIYGAPDLTLEVLSPSTRSKDMVKKRLKYQAAGVREYWIVDPDNQKVLVYDFEGGGGMPEEYSFQDVVPVHISEGRCQIDFARVLSSLDL